MTRRDRVLLLLASYPAVQTLTPQREGTRPAGKPGSKDLRRQGLFEQGSYAALEHCLDRLAEQGYRKILLHMKAEHMGVEIRNEKGKRVPPRRKVADNGVSLLVKWMPRDIFVPAEIVQAHETMSNPRMLTYLRRKEAA